MNKSPGQKQAKRAILMYDCGTDLGFSDTAQKQIERDIYGMTDIIGAW